MPLAIACHPAMSDLLRSLPHDFCSSIAKASWRQVGQPITVNRERSRLHIRVPVWKCTSLNVENDSSRRSVDGVGTEVRHVALDDSCVLVGCSQQAVTRCEFREICANADQNVAAVTAKYQEAFRVRPQQFHFTSTLCHGQRNQRPRTDHPGY